MLRMRWLGLVGGLLLTSSGCCWWADKMCPQSHYAAPACYPAPQYCPCSQGWTPAPSNYCATPPPPPGCGCPPPPQR